MSEREKALEAALEAAWRLIDFLAQHSADGWPGGTVGQELHRAAADAYDAAKA